MDNTKKNLFLLLSSRLISLTGSGIQSIAIPLYILDLTSSATMMGLFSMISLIPAIIFAPVAGIIGDRFSKKNIMIISDLVRGLLVIVMAMFTWMGSMSIAVLLICQVFISTFDIIFGTSATSIITDMFKSDSLKRVNGLKGSCDNITAIAGPLVGGVIYGLWGMKAVFTINALSFFVASILEAALAYSNEIAAKKRSSSINVKEDMKDVLLFIKRNTAILHLFTFAIVINFFDNPFRIVGLPFLFKKVIGFSSQQYGVLMTCFVVGMLLGNILLASYFAKKNTGKVMKTGLVIEFSVNIILCIFAMPWVVTIFSGEKFVYFLLYLLILVPIGLFESITSNLVMTNIQQSVPREYMSRFMSIMFMVFRGSTPLGVLILGTLLDIYAAHVILIGLSAMMLAAVVMFITWGSEKAFNVTIDM